MRTPARVNWIMRGPWAKWPAWLYRLRLGWMLDHRTLMITHLGRKTGKVHQTVVEVIRYEPATREAVVVSGYGEASDWFRNIRERQAVLVDIGRETYVPEQRILDEEEAYQELTSYQREHPRMARLVFAMMGWRYGGPEDEQRRQAAQARVLAFRPQRPPAQAS